MLTQNEMIIRPIMPFLGAEIEGVDASVAIASDILIQLDRASIEHQLQVMRSV